MKKEIFMKEKNENTMHVAYKTDDIEHARHVAANYENVSVEYHNPNSPISPTVTSIINGKKITKYNPEYIKYLREKYPDISDEEISRCIEEAISEVSKDNTEGLETKKR